MLTSSAGIHTLPFLLSAAFGTHLLEVSPDPDTRTSHNGMGSDLHLPKTQHEADGEEKEAGTGQAEGRPPSYCSGPQVGRSAVRDPMFKEIRANLGPLSLDPHPDESSPDWDIRQWPGTERHGPVRWGSVKREPGVRDAAKQMRSEQDSQHLRLHTHWSLCPL